MAFVPPITWVTGIMTAQCEQIQTLKFLNGQIRKFTSMASIDIEKWHAVSEIAPPQFHMHHFQHLHRQIDMRDFKPPELALRRVVDAYIEALQGCFTEKSKTSASF